MVSKESGASAQKDESPNELFKRVALNDAKQNSRLSAKMGDTGGGCGAQGAYSKGPTKMRFMVCTLGLMSLAMSQMSRMVINQSITQMVDPIMQVASSADTSISTDGSCPWPEQKEQPLMSTTPMSMISTTTEATPTTSTRATPTTPTDLPRSSTSTSTTTTARPETATSPIEPTLHPLDLYPTSATMESETSSAMPVKVDAEGNFVELPDSEVLGVEQDGRPVSTNTSQMNESTSFVTQPELSAYDQFKWTMKQQGLVLGGFYYSYFVFMILGGRLAEVYGAKYVILLSVAGSALINLATPWMARTNFTLLVMSRVLMGAIQSGVFPAMYALISKWLTMSEASIFAPLIKVNLRLGMVLGSLVPGLVSGWQNVFYFTGAVSALWSLAWIFIASSDPVDNKWVSPGELAHINRKKRKTRQQQQEKSDDMIEMGEAPRAGVPRMEKKSEKPTPSLKTPWLKIWTAPSVIGLIVVKLTFNYALDFLAIELPSYLKYVHHATRQQISAITTPMFGIQVFLIVFVGWLAKVTIQRRPLGFSKTTFRKVFQGLASFGMALSFFLLTFNDCNLTYVTILLLLISFLSMFTAGGETMLPYDLSEEYPATIIAIANSIANVSGVTTTTLAAIVLGDQGGNFYRWNVLMYLIAGANLIGGLAFSLLVKAEPIDFESKKSKSSDLEAA